MIICFDILYVYVYFSFQEVWLEGVKLASAMNFRFPTMVPTSLQAIVTNASFDGIQLMADLMAWDPNKRLTAAQVYIVYTSTIQ